MVRVEMRARTLRFGEVDLSKCVVRVERRVGYGVASWTCGGHRRMLWRGGTWRRCMDVWALIVQEELCCGVVFQRIAGDKFRRVGIFYRLWELDTSSFERRTITIV